MSRSRDKVPTADLFTLDAMAPKVVDGVEI